MSKEPRTIPAEFRGYLLPRSAYESLIQTREQLRLLAQFTEARSERIENLYLSSDALSELFERVASHVDDALAAVVEDPKAA